MTDSSNGRIGRLQRLIVVVAAITWIAVVAGVALLMRFWLPDVDVKSYFASIEDADTEQVSLDRPLPDVLQPLADALPSAAVSGTFYLPLYGDLYVGGERSLKHLSTTLSLRNTSGDQAVVITALTYFDESGKALGNPVSGPHSLAPMNTAKIYVDRSGTADAPITAAVVAWEAETEVPPPLVEAVTVGNYGPKAISFVTYGVARP